MNKKVIKISIELLSNIVSPYLKHFLSYLLKKCIKIPEINLSDEIYEKDNEMLISSLNYMFNKLISNLPGIINTIHFFYIKII